MRFCAALSGHCSGLTHADLSEFNSWRGFEHLQDPGPVVMLVS